MCRRFLGGRPHLSLLLAAGLLQPLLPQPAPVPSLLQRRLKGDRGLNGAPARGVPPGASFSVSSVVASSRGCRALLVCAPPPLPPPSFSTPMNERDRFGAFERVSGERGLPQIDEDGE